MGLTIPVLSWDELFRWSENLPFKKGETQAPCVVRWRDAVLADFSAQPDGQHRTPVWMLVSTQKIGFVCIMSVAPGDNFDIDNHPNLETYYMLQGVFHLSNPDTGQVIELHPGDAALIPANQYHRGYNFSTEEVRVLACVPGAWHTPEMKENPELIWGYDRTEIRLYDGARENGEFGSKLGNLRQWPPADRLENLGHDNQRLPRSEWLRFITGSPARNAVLTSFYLSTPTLAAGSVVIPPNRISSIQRFSGETVIYVERDAVAVNIVNTGVDLWAEAGDCVFIPAGVPFQYHNTLDRNIEPLFFHVPWPETDWHGR